MRYRIRSGGLCVTINAYLAVDIIIDMLEVDYIVAAPGVTLKIR